MTVSYRMTVQPRGDELVIRFGQPRLEDFEAFGMEVPARFREMRDRSGGRMSLPMPAPVQAMAQYAHFIPDAVVGTDGEFLRLDDVAKFQATLRAMFERTAADEPPNPRAQRMQELMTSEDFVTMQVTQLWEGIVGLWAGEELELGREYRSAPLPADSDREDAGSTDPVKVTEGAPEDTTSGRHPSPRLTGDLALMEYSLSLVGSLPCSRGGVNRRCVEVELRTSPRGFMLQLLVKTLMAQLETGDSGGKLPSPAVPEDLEMTSVLRVVTEPDGLIPHAYTMTKTTRASSSEGGEEQVDTLDVRYTYR